MKALLLLLVLSGAAAPVGQDLDLSQDLSTGARKALARMTPLPPPPADPTNRVADDPRAARLGQWLFFDQGLSADGQISCATCHDPAKGFSDGKPVGETLARGTRRSPTVVNAAYMRWLFWDGRADSLWGQAVEPIENPIEMAGDRLAVAHHLAGDEHLRAAYERVFGPLPEVEDGARFPAHARPVLDQPEHPHDLAWETMDAADKHAIDGVLANVGKAIAAYERRLVRGDAPFDRYAAHLLGRDGGDGGDGQALSASAQRGLALFLGRGNCTLCHAGANLTDSEFHNTAAPPGEFGDPQDPGRYAGAAKVLVSSFSAAGPHSDDPDGRAARRVRRLRVSTESFGEFRTPSLRNMLQRAPYMHAGQFADLESVVRFYSTLEGASGRSHHQESVLSPLRLEEGQIQDLVHFLESLEGQPVPAALTRAPASPGAD